MFKKSDGSSKAYSSRMGQEESLRTSEIRPMVQQPLTEGQSYKAFIDGDWKDMGIFDHAGESHGFHDQNNNYYFTKDGNFASPIEKLNTIL
jgi:hypothetical protein